MPDAGVAWVGRAPREHDVTGVAGRCWELDAAPCQAEWLMRPSPRLVASFAVGGLVVALGGLVALGGVGSGGRADAFATSAPTVTGTVITAPTTAAPATAATPPTSPKPASTSASSASKLGGTSPPAAAVRPVAAQATAAPSTSLAATTAAATTAGGTVAPTTLAPVTATVPQIVAGVPPSTEVATSVVQVGDRASSTKIDRIWLALVGLSLLVAAATAWFWWRTRPVEASLEGLELIGTGRFLNADDGTRARHLAAVRDRRGIVSDPIVDDVEFPGATTPVGLPEPGPAPA